MQDPVSRSIELGAAPGEVWRALTDASLLSEWFEADAGIDARVNGPVRFRFADGSELRGVVLECDPQRRLSFRWRDVHALDAPTVVELALEPAGAGTRLIVTESPGIVSVPWKPEQVPQQKQKREQDPQQKQKPELVAR